MGDMMKNSFEIRTEGIPADYDEMMTILYGLDNGRSSKSRFIEAAAVRKSAVRIELETTEESPTLYLDDSDF